MLHLLIWLQGGSSCIYKDAHSTSSILTPRFSSWVFPNLDDIPPVHPKLSHRLPSKITIPAMSWTPWPRLVFALIHGVAATPWYDGIASIRVFSPAQQEDAQSALAGSNWLIDLIVTGSYCEDADV